MADRCPVCRRTIYTTSRGYVVRHKDKVLTHCPMSGHQLPNELRDGRSV